MAHDVPSNAYALILAGGSGTRFWPVSRNHLPKQLLNLFGDTTLIEATVSRVAQFVPRENILILTNARQAEEIARMLPDFPSANIIAEPDKRDTAPAIALGVAVVAARDSDATMMVLPSDQLIQDTAAYAEVMGSCLLMAANSDALVTVGIKPTWACPSFGYVERGASVSGVPGSDAVSGCEVVRFTEKPDPQTAQTFLDSGNFVWNAGMFIWSVATVRKELATHCPELAAFIDKVESSGDVMATVTSDFGNLPKLSIDYALMEKATTVWNVEATFDWDDVGSWISVASYLDGDDNENRTNCDVSQIDSSGNIVFSREGKKIALLGVDDLIVVQTDDALLVARRDKADDIKKLVDLLPDELC